MKLTSVFNRNIKAYNEGYGIIVNKGGTRSSKSWSLMQLLFLIAVNSKKAILISVVSESMPHLKRGCIRDFKTMLEWENLWDESAWNATDKIYKVGKSQIEFFSVDSPGKVHGPARDILFINECNNIESFEIYRQLAVRTKGTIFLDYNPRDEFWVDEHILTREDVFLIHSTYKDNDFLTRRQIEEIESNKHDENWWKVYGLGLTGSREGLCIQNWKQVGSLPSEYKHRWLGLDFGFTNDPTAIIDVYLSGGELWLDEVEYSPGMTNPDIARKVKEENLQRLNIVADSAEQKSIVELQHSGLSVEPADKGPDSIKNGIDILNRYQINVTKRSLNLIRELRNYKWKTDVDGKPMNVPIDKFNHAIDAVRYVALNKLSAKNRSKGTKIKRIIRNE